MSARRPGEFDPRSILASLQGHDVSCVLIGGLARVARGSDEITRGVDVCPSLKMVNIMRLEAALTEMSAVRRDGEALLVEPESLADERIVELSTTFGDLKLVSAPAGVPRGYEVLKAGASGEHLGHGLRPDIASTADLVAMSAALRRPEDLQRLPILRRILELEAAPSQLVAPPPTAEARPVRRLQPGDAQRMSRPARRPGQDTGGGIER